MWVWLRNTASRGRAVEPESFLRMRARIRVRMSSLVLIFISLRSGTRGAGLARLLLQDLAHIADALLLVRVGLAQAADLGGHLADLLAVDAGHDHVGLFVDRDLDPLGDLELDRVRVAEREDHLLPLDLGLV